MLVRFFLSWVIVTGAVGGMIYFLSSKERSEIYKIGRRIALAGGIAFVLLLIAIFGLNNLSGL